MSGKNWKLLGSNATASLVVVDAAGRAGGTDPHLSLHPDASNAAKRKFRFLPALSIGTRVLMLPLTENPMLLLSMFLQVIFYLGEKDVITH